MYSRCYAIVEQTTMLCNPFLGNGSVNTFPLQRIRPQKIELLFETVFSTRSVDSCFKEDNCSARSFIVACVYRDVFIGPLPSNALVIHVTIFWSSKMRVTEYFQAETLKTPHVTGLGFQTSLE
jgi:hypothetical protein